MNGNIQTKDISTDIKLSSINTDTNHDQNTENSNDSTSVTVSNGRDGADENYKQKKYGKYAEQSKEDKKHNAFLCCGKSKSKDKDMGNIGMLEMFSYSTTFEKCVMGIGLLFAALLGCTTPLNFAVFGQVIQRFIGNDSNSGNSSSSRHENLAEEIKPLIYYFLTIGILASVSGCSCIFCFQWTADRQLNRIRKKFFRSVLSQSIGWFDLHQAAEICTHFSEDIPKLNNGLGEKLALFCKYAASSCACFAMTFTQSWQLSFCLIIFVPFLSFVAGSFVKVIRNLTIKEFRAYAKAGAVADQAFRSIKTVQAFQGQEKEVDRFKTNLAFAVSLAGKKGLVWGLNQGALWGTIFVLFATALWLGIVFHQQFGIPPHNIVPVYLGMIFGSISIGNLANNLEDLTSARAAASKVFRMIRLEPEMDATSEEALIPEKLHGHIKFEDVHFAYPARPDRKILNGFNLEIEQGKHVALVGPSGCGKSTIVQLIQRLYDPQDGRVLIDTMDLKDIHLKWLRQRIGIVSQEPVLFDLTIAENIKFGKLDATQEEVEQAAIDANAHDFIKLLPQGYDTVVGERGAQVSGGQKQRIAIARALIRNPSVLLLDEATSALDQQSETIVQNALNKAKEGRTTITVAHRLSTIRNADKIITINDGQIMEMGTHNELMDARGLYFELVQMQTEIERKGDKDVADVEIVEEVEFDKSRVTLDLNGHFRRTLSIKSRNSERKINLVARSSTRRSRRSQEKEEDKLDDNVLKKEEVKEVSLRQILHYNSPEWHLILAGTIVSFVIGLNYPTQAILMSQFIKALGTEDDEKQMNETHVVASILLGMAFTVPFLRIAQRYCFCKSGAKLTSRLRFLAFESLINQDMEYFDKPQNQVSSLTTKLSADAANIDGATGSKIGQVCEALACICGGMCVAIVFGWKLGLVLIIFLPLMVLSGLMQGHLMKGTWKKENKHLENAGKICAEVLDNIRTVASLGREDHFFSTFENLVNLNRISNLKTSIILGVCYGVASSLEFFAYAVAFYYGSTLVEKGEMQFYNVFRVFSALVFGSTMIGRQLSYGIDYAVAKLGASRIIAVINAKPKLDVRETSGIQLDNFDGRLEIQNAVFHYPTRPTVRVLNNINLKINSGETVALVGASGCGKSTCIQILQRFYELNNGSVFANSVDLKQLNISWLRRQIGIVSQEPTLFDCSIAENIAYGDNTRVVPMEEIMMAARSANIHNFIASLPAGYDTNVGIKGTQLSGGQKQRIAIARALVRNPKVLLLDEATSALDAESEKTVQEALDKAGLNRTCVIIAHRLSTIQNADRIAVINKGGIVEEGTHNNLMAMKGVYYRLYSAQNQDSVKD